MNTTNSPSDFVDNWLDKLREKFPKSKTVTAVTEATKSSRLDEAKLLKRLRDLSKPSKKEGRDDQS